MKRGGELKVLQLKMFQEVIGAERLLDIRMREVREEEEDKEEEEEEVVCV